MSDDTQRESHKLHAKKPRSKDAGTDQAPMASTRPSITLSSNKKHNISQLHGCAA